MMTPAYSRLYLSKSSRTLGSMLHYGVVELGIDGNKLLNRFIQSGIAEEFERGNPKYIVGMSGTELFSEVMSATEGSGCGARFTESYGRSAPYWTGWMLAHYQWYSGKSFRDILDAVPYDELIGLYGTLHEADIQKSYEVMDAHLAGSESRLKATRKRCGLTQAQLAEIAGVSLNTIRAYERKSKDINKAQVDIVMRLSLALKCNITDLLN